MHHKSQKLETLISSLVRPVFRPALHDGLLKIKEKDGALYTMGDGNGPAFTMEINSQQTLRRIFSDPAFQLGETYAAGEWKLIEGDLGRFVSWLVANNKTRLIGRPQASPSANTPYVSKQNVAHHYDLGNDLYESFLDKGLNYSCAFFDDHRMSLRDAQLNKIYTTLSRSKIKPGMHVLDIGCGWGELCRILTQCVPDTPVTGITLSENQLALARTKNQALRQKPPEFILTDYREHARKNPAKYDRIISIGMFEHVGRRHYAEFFKSIHDLLKPGGQALVHSIMRPEPGGNTSKWLDTYIFPGGCIPYMPEALEIAQKQGLSIPQAPFIHESHNYAETLRHWRHNYNAACTALDPERYDKRFHRIWNFYLACSEAAFEGLGYYVAQMVFSKP